MTPRDPGVDLGGPVLDAGGEVAVPERRQEDPGHDILGDRVVVLAVGSAQCHAHLPVFGQDKDKDPVVSVRKPDPPVVEKPGGKILQRGFGVVVTPGRKRQHRRLYPGFRLQQRQTFAEPRFGARIKHIGQIVDEEIGMIGIGLRPRIVRHEAERQGKGKEKARHRGLRQGRVEGLHGKRRSQSRQTARFRATRGGIGDMWHFQQSRPFFTNCVQLSPAFGL